MTTRKILLLFLLLVLVAAGGAYAWAMRHPEVAAITPPDPASLDRTLVEDGELLAGMGNCRVCHTRVGGRAYAGGLALPTPFGVIHSTNITPDVETGIGSWSEEAFIRAMREGVDREGNHLYPAFPYDYFARVTDQDLRAIYAYLMSQEPIAAPAEPNGLGFPFNIRPLVAGWKLLFHDPSPFQPNPEMDEEWNRGAYLAQGLGHCGACHSPRDAFGAAPKFGAAGAYAGGEAEGWYAPPLDASSPAPIPWTLDTIVNYLIDGWDGDHGIAGGPMTPVVNDLYDQSEDDVFAIGAYVMSLKGGELPDEQQAARIDAARAFADRVEWGHPENPPIPEDPLLAEGARVFESQCAECHESGGKPVPLALTTVVNAPTAANLIRITFEGVQPAPRGASDRSMPPRAIQISDAEMVALAAFVRDRFTDLPPWGEVEALVAAAREAGGH